MRLLANSAALGIRGQIDEPLTDIPAELHPKNWQTFHPDGTRLRENRVLRHIYDGRDRQLLTTEVVAENRSTLIDTMLGLRFPDTDIPPQARVMGDRDVLTIAVARGDR